MKFAICAGHGDKDPGVVVNGIREADIATELRDMMAVSLRIRGHSVSTDSSALMQNLPLAKSMLLVPGKDVAIELHCNGSANFQATGVEVLALPKDKKRAQAIAKAIADVLVLRLRGDGGWQDQSISPHGTLGFVRVGGMIVELFFLTNSGDTAAYLANKNNVANAIEMAMEKM